MKAIVLAGGEGTRLRPLTSTRPKPLMPVADRPCIDYILRSLVEAGIKKIIIATHHLSDKLIKSIGDGLEYDASIVYSFEETPAGTAGAVKRVEDFIDKTFIVAMGDIVADVDIGALIDFHRDRKAAITIALTKVEDPSQYGVATINEKGRIQRFQEKPKKEEAFSNLVNAGIYVLEASVIEFIPEGRMFDFSKDLFPMLLAKRIPVYGKVLDGVWMDIGRPGDLLRASLEIVNRVGKERAIPGVDVSGPLMIGEGVSFGAGAKIEGPCYFGGNVRVEAGAVIRKSCLQDGVTACNGSRISNALILAGTKVGKRCEISDSVIASACDIGDEAHVISSVVGDGVNVKSHASLRDATLP
jgi:mannose-1-phosphate guanylyltransferase